MPYNLTFTSPYYFLLLPLALGIIFLWQKKQKEKALPVAFLTDLQTIYGRNNWSFYLRLLLISLISFNFIFILSNPNLEDSQESIKKNGIDIVLTLDTSGSMLASDLQPNRIEAAKKVITDFITQLKTDRVGLTIFAGKPFTSTPLTFDYNILAEILTDISTDTINQRNGQLQGTAIGDAILSAINTLDTVHKTTENSPAIPEETRAKVIILATDGEANLGVDPLVAAQLATEKEIKIYTIGIGSLEGGYIEYQSFFGTQKQAVPGVDETTLKEIAKITNGQYFRATDNQTFQQIFQQISQLEKKELTVETKKQYHDLYYQFNLSLLILLLFLFGLETFYFIRN